ncbi:MAG: hypothetical protein ACRD1B_07510 [Thermoanaerobaculia bacterium]
MFRKAHMLLASLVCGVLLAGGARAQGFGYIDAPKAGATVSGIVSVSGWAVDFKKVDKVELFIDSLFVNRADTNQPRADVFEVFPQFVGSPNLNPGFLTSFLARNYVNGTHALSVKVTKSDQSTFTLGPNSIIVDNSIGQPPIGNIDVPGGGTTGASGSLQVLGWALDDVAVDHVDFIVDNKIVAAAIGRGLPGSTALYGSLRPDVRAAYPDVPGSLFSGFLANIDTTRLIAGLHTLDVRATDNLGANALVGSRTIDVVNNIALLGPFGWLDTPLDKASLICSQGIGGGGPAPSPPAPPSIGPVFLNFASGWALSTGTRPDRGSVVWVELLLDGAIISNTARDCFISNGRLTNCYGLNRPDVVRVFPGYLNGDNSGFFFAFAFAQNDPFGLLTIVLPTAVPSVVDAVGFTRPGKHTLSIRAGSDEGSARQIAAISVDILCDSTAGNQPAFGSTDAPQTNDVISGTFVFFGWAFDFQGVQRIDVDLDGQVVARSDNGSAVYGLLRADVPANDLRVPPPGDVGWSAVLDTTRFGDGPHEVVIYVIDNQGFRSEIGRRRFSIDNNTRTAQ